MNSNPLITANEVPIDMEAKQAEIDELKREKELLLERVRSLEKDVRKRPILKEIRSYTQKDFLTFKNIKEGADGVISIAMVEELGQIAVKKFKRLGKEEPLTKYRREIEILIKHTPHPNIVQIYGILWDEYDKSKYLGYVMEYIEGGSLHDVIYGTTEYHFLQICRWIEQISRGLQFLHMHGIIHQDIKPPKLKEFSIINFSGSSILFAANQLKLADFGRSKIQNTNSSTSAGAGTCRYMAPETISSGIGSPSSDVYSLGITAWEIFHRKMPYFELKDTTNFTLSNKVITGTRPSIDKMDPEVAKFIERCWHGIAECRPHVNEIIDFFGKKPLGISTKPKTISIVVDRYMNKTHEDSKYNFKTRNLIIYFLVTVTTAIIWSMLSTDHNLATSKPINLPYKNSALMQLQSETILVLGGMKSYNGDGIHDGMAMFSKDRYDWILLQLRLPYKAGYAGSVYLNGEIYLFGGDDRKSHKLLYKLDKDLNWIRLADMNIDRYYITNSFLQWDGYIWVFGGEWTAAHFTKSVERYDPKENKWTIMRDMKYARQHAAVVLWNNTVIITGGQPDNSTNIVECYSLNDDCQIDLPSIPIAFISRHSLVSYGSKLVIMGGDDGEVNIDSVWEIDPSEANPKWKQLASMNYAGNGFPGIAHLNSIYAIGGRPDSLSFLNRFEIFDGNHWEEGPPLFDTWGFMSALIIPRELANRLSAYKMTRSKNTTGNTGLKEGNTILIIGGMSSGTDALNSMTILSNDRLKWIEANFQLPYDVVAGCTLYLNEELYLIGGWNSRKVVSKLDEHLNWIRLADMNIGRGWIVNSCMIWNGYIWVFGGYNSDQKYLKSVERYDPKEDKWTMMPDMKYTRAASAAIVWNGIIIITGGASDTADATNAVECYNLQNICWPELPNMPHPLARHSLVSHGNRLIIMGGFDNEHNFDTVWEIYPYEENAVWRSLSPMKYPSYSFTGIYLDQEIYVIGGNMRMERTSDRVEIFNGEFWRDGPSFPVPSHLMSAVVVPGDFADRLSAYKPTNIKRIAAKKETILVIGGLDSSDNVLNKTTLLRNDWLGWEELKLKLPYDIVAGCTLYLNEELYLIGGWNSRKVVSKLDEHLNWIRLADMNIGRGWIVNSCLVWNGYIWVFGGYNSDQKHLKSVERYDPKENKWTQMRDMKYARSSAAVVLWSGRVIITGGESDNGKIISSIECYNVLNACSTRLPSNMPTSMSGHSLVLYDDDKLIAIGGYGGGVVYDTVWEIIPFEDDLVWKPPMQTASCSFAVAVLGEEIYVIGGLGGPNKAWRRVEIFDGQLWRSGPMFLYNSWAMTAVVVPQDLADRLSNYNK